MTLGERIQQLRKSVGLSQEQLADLTGVSRQAISKWETDQSAPEIDKLLALSRAFSVSTDELLGNATAAKTPAQDLKESVKMNMKKRQFTIGWITAIAGLVLLAAEFLLLLIVRNAEQQFAVRTGSGWYSDIMHYAGTQPMTTVFIITGVIIFLGVCMTVFGLVRRR
ncbi:MAG: helix-turn-helix domain-containing protein [Burkholderiales bacterium]